MLVEHKDGCCRTCGCTLRITDADDATMLVECTECSDSYSVEPDAFGDGAMHYYLRIMTHKHAHEGDDA